MKRFLSLALLVLVFISMVVVSYYIKSPQTEMKAWLKMVGGAGIPFLLIALMMRRRLIEESKSGVKKVDESDRERFRNVGSGDTKPPKPIDLAGNPILHAQESLEEDLSKIGLKKK